MKQAVSYGFYDNGHGGDVVIPPGSVRSDDHPDVRRCPGIFRDVDIEDPHPAPIPVKAPRAAKPAAAKST